MVGVVGVGIGGDGGIGEDGRWDKMGGSLITQKDKTQNKVKEFVDILIELNFDPVASPINDTK